jgi:hypothetical protein
MATACCPNYGLRSALFVWLTGISSKEPDVWPTSPVLREGPLGNWGSLLDDSAIEERSKMARRWDAEMVSYSCVGP